MAEHPFIGMSSRGGSLEPYVIGTGRPVWELVEAARAAGSAKQAGDVLGIDPTLVQAALDYYHEHGAGTAAAAPPEAPGDDGDPKSALQRIGEVLALFSGIAAIVYVAGGVVLGGRLYLASVNSDAVIGQLPRELLLTIGVGQVLLPVLAVAGLYAGWRMLREDRPTVPDTPRLADPANGWGERVKAVGAILAVTAVVVLPGAIAAMRAGGDPDRRFSWIAGTLVLAVIAATIAVGVRARIASAARASAGTEPLQKAAWSSSRSRWEMTAVWGALGVVAAIAFWPSALQLQPAKVCTTSGFEEQGELIGQTSSGVYLAEHPFRGDPGRSSNRKPGERRVATFTAAQTEEVFIGGSADKAYCDPSGLRGAAIASRGAANARIHLGSARTSLNEVRRMTDPEARAWGVLQVTDRVFFLTDAVREVAMAADRTTPGEARRIWDAIDRARIAAAEVRDDAAIDQINGAPREVTMARLLADAERALAAGREASAAADLGETAVVQHVKGTKP